MDAGQGLGGSFRRVDRQGLNITKPGESTATLSGRWAPGDAVHPAIMWGYRPAAALRSWNIQKTAKAGEWSLDASIERIEAFMLMQQPLYFAAPKHKGGFWMWPIIGKVEQVGTNLLRATLGQPEQ